MFTLLEAVASHGVQPLDGLSISTLFESVPRDPAAVVIYSLLLVSLFLVWRGGHRRKAQR